MDAALHWVRRRQHSLTRAVLALFCLAWLQAAALPCAMAGAASTTMPAGAQHCPYCPPGDATSTTPDHAGTCAYPHQPQADARASVLFVAITVPSFTPVLGEAVRDGDAPATGSAEPAPRVPIALSFCRFLE